jgi:selenoprotein W-related protein
LAAEITESYQDADIKLIDGSGGVFEVTVDGTLVFSKKALGRHAEPGEVIGLIQDRSP